MSIKKCYGKYVRYVLAFRNHILEWEMRFKDFFMFIFILWYSTEIIHCTTMDFVFGIPIDTINSVLNWLIFGLLMVQIVLFQSYTLKEIFLIAGITLPVAVAVLLSGHKGIMSTWMFIVAAKNVDFDKVILTAYRILIIMIPLVIFLYFLGFIDAVTIMRGDTLRSSLGFSHPNQLGIKVFQLITCYFYVSKNKRRVLQYLLVVLAIGFVYIVPMSQTACVCLTVFLMLFLIYDFIERQRPLIMKIYMGCLLAGAFLLNIFSIILSYIDVNESFILAQIDRWMSYRFSHCHTVWQVYGVSFFGQRVYIEPAETEIMGIQETLWLDNAYVSMLLQYGILVFLLVSVCYLYLIKSTILKKNYVLVIILFLYALYGVMEVVLYSMLNNIFLIAFSGLLYKKINPQEINSHEYQ